MKYRVYLLTVLVYESISVSIEKDNDVCGSRWIQYTIIISNTRSFHFFLYFFEKKVRLKYQNPQKTVNKPDTSAIEKTYYIKYVHNIYHYVNSEFICMHTQNNTKKSASRFLSIFFSGFFVSFLSCVRVVRLQLYNGKSVCIRRREEHTNVTRKSKQNMSG